ncbi:chromosome partitioning protein [Subtercola sp. Z020]|uniref:polysaccharide biosynthesis tyrosine autokinase n=1 Tax=Subtercola sp. Z020 TaxID=2080582 RepID=UPI000CE8C7A8|nr:polysaccharide biosynthesis tyrosine autokinase [Subtercola sp. Z020]PPF81338.1 chromosome partitioning protein [Subtercola sp. Z020]
MHIRNYLRVLQRSWILIAGIILVSVAASATYAIVQTPLYQASTKVYVSTSSSATTAELQQGNTFTQQAVKTYADLVSTPIVLDPVIAQYGLAATSDELAKSVTATAPLDTTIIEITVTSDSAADAATIANAVATSFSTNVPALVPEAADGTPQVKISSVKAATAPLKPTSPNVPLNIALGLIVGLLVGLGLAFLREALDNRIRSQRDTELITTAPVLGAIFFDPRAAERPLVVHAEPKSPQAESYRSLRTNLQFLEFADLPHTIVITSSVAAEGKSSVSSNLAIALADANSSVIVIDADLRRPRLASYLGLEGAVGLTDVLIGRVELADALQQWGEREMYVLPAGSIPPNPSELLGGPAMKKLLATLESEFDTVIIDAPPLLPVTDAAILAKATRGAIVVASAGKVHKAQLRSAIDILDNVGATVLGLVLTMLPTRGADAYGYGHYSYAYAEDETSSASAEPVQPVNDAPVAKT